MLLFFKLLLNQLIVEVFKIMILIIGLGNAGIKYKNTRHNIGFMTVESLKIKNKDFSDWKYEKKLLAEISNGKIDKEKINLAKPQAFMNNSGRVVKKLIRNYLPINKSAPEQNQIRKAVLQRTAFSNKEISNLFIVHDDIDLPLEKIKITKNRGAAGHKGVQSIINELKSKNFIRIRIGIRPKTEELKNVERFVLQKFNKEEKGIVKKIIEKACQTIELIIKQGIVKAMNKYN